MKKLIIVLIAMSFLFFGCEGGGEESTLAGPTFVGGTNGLLINFLQDAPPNNVFDNARSEFQVAVQVKNSGEWDVEKGELAIALSGIDPADFNNPVMKKDSESIMTATKRDPEGAIIQGTQQVFTFPGFSYQDDLPGDIPHTIKADACYEYGTKALTSLCVKKDLTGTDTEICTINSARPVANSGAPVQVASVRETAGGTETVLLTITLRQTGAGEVFEKGSECAQGINTENVVNVKIDTGMTKKLSCSGLGDGTGEVSGKLTLYNGERQLTCTQETAGQGDFVKTVSITLEYDHRVSASKTVVVKG